MEQQQIRELYARTWQAMIAKYEQTLDECHSDDFVLVHMTGTHQPKPVYIRSIMDGTLNYYSEKTEHLDILFTSENTADVTGKSKVSAAVYGGGCHTWHLLMQFKASKANGKWQFCYCEVSTY